VIGRSSANADLIVQQTWTVRKCGFLQEIVTKSSSDLLHVVHTKQLMQLTFLIFPPTHGKFNPAILSA
jgi:hypothetical protein